MHPAMWILAAVFGAGLGASLGSFLGVVADRVPRGESLGGRSHCACGQPILARDNVPIVGYVARRGRARCCGARIPLRFLGFEVAGAAIGLAVVGGVALAVS
ncbi:MAG TPA: prepilin peptidase [Acidimicrobiia bacterium]|nr:prepilin peptidase [Acidimicrobiia bacterium]